MTCEVNDLKKDTEGKEIGNTWLKITIKADPVLVEPISDFLVGVMEAGVETGAPDERLYGTVNGYLQQANPLPDEVDGILARVKSYLAELADIFRVPLPVLVSTMIDEEDWGKNWKRHFKPFSIVPGLVIAPTWEDYRPVADEAVITMDPGMAFGTGHHATTSLSLQFLRRTLVAHRGARLLDVGTGTGILGMAAVLFGAAVVLGIDNDPEAVVAAEENVRRNRLQGQMRISLDPLSTLRDSYEIVVANIVHDVLIDMAGDLSRLTAAGGTLIVSGILKGAQVDNIRTVFSAGGMQESGQESREEWAALSFRKG